MTARRYTQLIACVVSCALTVSCASETLQGQSRTTPEWVTRTPADTDTEMLLVGLAVGRNVLDERAMRSRAMEHAREQAAALRQTEVEVLSQETIRERGYAPRGSDTNDAEYVRELRTSVRQSIRGVAQKESYWEKWHVDPGLLSRSFVRYKYYVLAGYPREEYERNIRRLTRVAVDLERAIDLLGEGRPGDAAEVLDGLLDEQPDAPAPVRLTLARAHEEAGMPDRAALVLEAALDLTEDEAALTRIAERLERLEGVFPDLTGRSAYFVVEPRPTDDAAPAMARAWIEDPAALSHLRVAAIEAEADWLLAVRLRTVAARGWIEAYGLRAFEARVECTVTAFDPRDGSPLANASASARGLKPDRTSSEESAARTAVRGALRNCLHTLAGMEE